MALLIRKWEEEKRQQKSGHKNKAGHSFMVEYSKEYFTTDSIT